MLPAPKAYDVLSDGVFCEGDVKGVEIKLSGSDAGFTYQLMQNDKPFGKAINGNGGEISFGYFKTIATYQVVATNLSTGCTNLMNNTITLQLIPQPKTFTLTGTGKYCEDSDGTEIVLNGSEKDIFYTLYKDGNIYSEPKLGDGNPIVFGKFKDQGVYTCFATSLDGHCTIVMDGSVTAVPVQLPDVTIQGKENPLMNATEIYKAINPEEGESYVWKAVNGNILNGENSSDVTIQWLTKKVGEVHLTRTNKYGCSNHSMLPINLVNNIKVDFEAKQKLGDAPFTVEFENKTTGVITNYFWDFGDGGSSPAVNPAHTYKKAGTYSVTLTVTHEGETQKQTKADLVKVLPPNSVNDDIIFNSNNSVGLSLIEPNPASNEIRFNYSVKSNQHISIAVYDLFGNKVIDVFDGSVESGNNTLKVDISKLLAGSYYLQINTNDGNVSKNFTVVR
jgi:PKD repeat protein